MTGRPLVDRSAWFVAVAALAVVAYLGGYNRQYPIGDWYLVHVLGYWAFALYWALGCLALGLEAVDTIAPRQYRTSEVPFVAFPLGVLVFAVVTFLVSIGGRLGTPFFYFAPLGLLATGWSALRRFFARARQVWSLERATFGRLDLLAVAFGAMGLFLVYAPILTPQNIQHDARWYHLPIAQQYAAGGAVARFPEGWFLGAYPHLSSLLYAWALLWPTGVVHRLELAAHLEFVVFLFTIASIPALVRRLVPGLRLPSSWAGFFLFPGFLVYDSNLSTGADHIAAIWAPGALIALLATVRTLSPRHAGIVGALAAGAALTKYSALCVAAPLCAAVVVAAARALQRKERRVRAMAAVGSLSGAFAVCWAPHWLKNWVFYGDPLYPSLHRFLPSHPWSPQAASYFRIFLDQAVLRPSRDLRGVLESVRVAFTLGFDVHDYGFHAQIPTFGFLFAATLYVVPLVRPGFRVVLTYALGVAAALVWFWTNHRDRYLQAILPWLVAATVVVLALLFRRSGRAGRLAAVLFVVTQVACGAGIFWLPAHIMTPGGHPFPHLVTLAKAGLEKRYGERFEPYTDWGFADWTALGKLLPKKSRVLVHEDRLWLGLDAPVVVDEAAWQAGIRYAAYANAAEVYDALRRYGVTHVVTGQNHGDGGDHGIAGNVVFWDFVSRHAERVSQHGKLTLWQMPKERPPATPLGQVLVLSCNLSQPLGLYGFGELQDRMPLESLDSFDEATDEIVLRADYVVTEDDCGATLDRRRLAAFRQMTTRGKVKYYRRASLSAVP